ncbi:MAG: hypothetical protein HOL92_02975 [Opitutales bacterium]|nr:hypothetical protein [Opitutales bacterium]
MTNSKKNFLVTFSFFLIIPFALFAENESRDLEKKIQARRIEYINWIGDTFGEMELAMAPNDGRRWALNHARLLLKRDVEKANHYFEKFEAPPRDADIYLIRFLRTLLDFRNQGLFSKEAEGRIVHFLTEWPVNDRSTKKSWPPNYTENHDLMQLTLGLFALQYREEDASNQVNELKRFIADRFKFGFAEFNSRCYQYHFTNPLIILADYAPDEDLKLAAKQLLDVLFAERLVLGISGYLGGPSLRCRTASSNHSLTERKVAYLEDARYDGFLPTVWLAFGLGEPRFDFDNSRVPGLEPASIFIASGNEPRLKQDEGLFYASSLLVPHRVVQELAQESKQRDVLVYNGRRYLGWPNDDHWETQKWIPGAINYYNTAHVSMGSIHSDGWNHQSRYNSILFSADPSMGLRLEIILRDEPVHKRRYEVRGRVVQHKNWMLGQGTLFEDGGIESKAVNGWNVYRVGKGLCAHMEFPDSYHVLQVSDLNAFPSERAFIAALEEPKKKGQQIVAELINGDRVSVNLNDMSIDINGEVRRHPSRMLHDCRSLVSVYGSGVISIYSKENSVTFDCEDFLN